MTRPTSLTDAEPALPSDGRAPARLGRLEFGKFCIPAEGQAVERNGGIPIGYSQLGWSEGFPRELIAHCHPDKMGISEGESDSPPDSPHGSVLRPVFIGEGGEERLRRVFYRVQTRAEEGDGRDGRRYTMARYLVADDGEVDPLTLLKAMDAEPMRGLTREEAKRMIRPLDADPADIEPGILVDAFLREAVVFVLSGVPLSITEEMTEGDFFSCVAALWRALPPALRTYLSAGWCVGSSYSGRLTVTRTSQRTSDAALFSPSQLAWSRPDTVAWDENIERVRGSFFDGWLIPGRAYTKYVFGRGDGNWPEGSWPPAEKVSELIGQLPALRLSEFPDWHDKVVVRAFRFPGHKADDRFALDALEDWLERGADDPRLRLDARLLTFQETRLDALDLIIKAQGDADRADVRRRGDEALWGSLSGRCPERFVMHIQGAGGDGSHRARFLTSLARGEVLESLGNLFIAEVRKEAAGLPVNVVEALDRCLEESLRPVDLNNLYAHAHLLQSPPEPYREWLGRGALRLMRAMASVPDAFGKKDYDRVIDLCKSKEGATAASNAALALRELIEGHRPPADYVRHLSPDQRSVFVEQFNQDWRRRDGNVARKRERLLDWFRVLGLQGALHPLLRLEAGEQLSREDVEGLADEVEQREEQVDGGYVPESLVPKVAAFVLSNWPRIGRRVRANARPWSLIHASWPSLYARALVGGTGTRHPDPAVVAAAAGIQIDFDDLNAILRSRITEANFGDFASLFWEWAVRLQPDLRRDPTAVDLCWYLDRDEPLPEHGPRQPREEVEIFARLASLSGAAGRFAERGRRLWDGATRAWQMMLLLSLFPEERFEPSPQQLGALIPHADWLREHLNEPRLHRSRRADFDLAIRPFHDIAYRGGRNLWQPGFVTESVVWAAFSGVPATMLPQGKLRAALRAYTGSNPQTHTAAQSEEVQDRQAAMCLTFLRAYDNSSSRPEEHAASHDQALRMVLYEFVFPLLCYELRRENVEAMLDSLGGDLRFPDYQRKKKLQYEWPPSRFYDLLKTLLGLIPHRGQMMMYLDAYYKSIER